MTEKQNVLDPLAEAENATPPTYTHFGKIDIEADYVIWPKGTRLGDCPPYNPDQHDPEDRVARVVVRSSPLPGYTHPFEHRRVITTYSREWASVTNPSIKELGLSARELIGKFAKYQFTKARTYKAADGTTKDATSFEFLEVYDSEEEALEAIEEFYEGLGVQPKSGEEVAKDLPFEEDAADSGGNGASGNGDDPERASLAQFLPAIWDQVGHDASKFVVKIAEMPMLAEHFDANSPEVQTLIGG